MGDLLLSRRFPYLFEPGHEAWERRALEFRGVGSMRERVRALGEAGLLTEAGAGSVRALALARGALARHDPLDDLALIIQELGAVPLLRAGGQEAALAEARAGRSVLAFALTEPEAGSDVRGLRTTATADGARFRLDGTKWFISNAPDADRAVVFARHQEGVGCFLVEEPPATAQEVAGHSVGRFDFVGTPATLVHPRGLPLALGTLERCRPTVGLAAWGMAAAAVEDTVAHLRRREQFGAPLAALPVVQARVAEMVVELEGLLLPALHACWRRDTAPPTERTGYDSAVGKVIATEGAFRVIDRAVQLHGGLGVEASSRVQQLWRDVRPLRIYEGATDVLLTLIAQHWLEPVRAPESR